MAKYYQWLGKWEREGDALCYGFPKKLQEVWRFILNGKSLKVDTSKLSFRLEPELDGVFPDQLAVIGYSGFLISERFKDILLKFKANVQLYPLTVTRAKSEKQMTYYLVIVPDSVKCLDMKKATCEMEGRRIEYIDKIAIDSKKAKNKLIFRLGEYRSHVLVHESIVKAVKKEKLTGAGFWAADGTKGTAGSHEQVNGTFPPGVLKFMNRGKKKRKGY